MMGLNTWWLWVVVAYVVASLVAIIAFAVDKRQARVSGRRISERTLHTIELLGGWPGSFIASRLFHHKTRKLAYRWVFWLIVLLHLGLLALLIVREVQ